MRARPAARRKVQRDHSSLQIRRAVFQKASFRSSESKQQYANQQATKRTRRGRAMPKQPSVHRHRSISGGNKGRWTHLEGKPTHEARKKTDELSLLMAAPLEACTWEEQHAVIRRLAAEDGKPEDIHRRILQQYEGTSVSLRPMYECYEKFQCGEFD